MTDTEKRRHMSFLELLGSTSEFDAIMKQVVEESSSSSSYEKLSIYLSIVELQNSTFMKLTELGLQVIELFIEHKALTSEEISKRLKCSRRYARDLCNKLMIETELLQFVIRDRVHIFVLKTATEQDYNRAAAVYETIKHSFSEKYRSTLGRKKQLFKCLDCREVFKAFELQPCPTCGSQKIAQYTPY